MVVRKMQMPPISLVLQGGGIICVGASKTNNTLHKNMNWKILQDVTKSKYNIIVLQNTTKGTYNEEVPRNDPMN